MDAELLCGECGRNEASYLVYFSAPIPDIGKTKIFNARILCEECNQARQTERFIERPTTISFLQLATWKESRIKWLISSKNKGFNCLDSIFWKMKIWKIYYQMKARGGLSVD